MPASPAIDFDTADDFAATVDEFARRRERAEGKYKARLARLNLSRLDEAIEDVRELAEAVRVQTQAPRKSA